MCCRACQQTMHSRCADAATTCRLAQDCFSLTMTMPAGTGLNVCCTCLQRVHIEEVTEAHDVDTDVWAKICPLVPKRRQRHCPTMAARYDPR